MASFEPADDYVQGPRRWGFEESVVPNRPEPVPPRFLSDHESMLVTKSRLFVASYADGRVLLSTEGPEGTWAPAQPLVEASEGHGFDPEFTRVVSLAANGDDFFFPYRTLRRGRTPVVRIYRAVRRADGGRKAERVLTRPCFIPEVGLLVRLSVHDVLVRGEPPRLLVVSTVLIGENNFSHLLEFRDAAPNGALLWHLKTDRDSREVVVSPDGLVVFFVGEPLGDRRYHGSVGLVSVANYARHGEVYTPPPLLSLEHPWPRATGYVFRFGSDFRTFFLYANNRIEKYVAPEFHPYLQDGCGYVTKWSQVLFRRRGLSVAGLPHTAVLDIFPNAAGDAVALVDRIGNVFVADERTIRCVASGAKGQTLIAAAATPDLGSVFLRLAALRGLPAYGRVSVFRDGDPAVSGAVQALGRVLNPDVAWLISGFVGPRRPSHQPARWGEESEEVSDADE